MITLCVKQNFPTKKAASQGLQSRKEPHPYHNPMKFNRKTYTFNIKCFYITKFNHLLHESVMCEYPLDFCLIAILYETINIF